MDLKTQAKQPKQYPRGKMDDMAASAAVNCMQTPMNPAVNDGHTASTDGGVLTSLRDEVRTTIYIYNKLREIKYHVMGAPMTDDDIYIDEMCIEQLLNTLRQVQSSIVNETNELLYVLRG